ncbi:phospho-sugar mutase [Aequorivita antarctica]|uniref:Phospho-sugar mutase n=1 Tax=Aequorivita antarctica TaxID=153266 RepID=A0A5C6Z1N9_9FLAO|nr:phospho-sugar mutase [Aequorivita antarctica]TXD73413.1 phospho-sugar mutase [Aequorivita antarctica]SRX76293.1 Phosphoglucomutase [Aequorivita antarctica]
MIYVDPKILARVNQWLTPFFDEKTQHDIKEMIAYDPDGLEDSFYKNLEFGTGGMRGIMGLGDNRINKYTLGKNTQGLSNYLKKQFPSQEIKVAIAYDCRHNSKEFAKVVSDVFSANEIKVFLFSELRPTPELSFAVKYLDCQAGIVLTASHNPPEYNGYKVYWEDGGQLVPPQDGEIIAEINSLKYEDIKFEANESLIQYIDVEVDDAFTKASVENGTFNTSKEAKDNLKIVFTSLHGTSITMIPKVLEHAGFNNVLIVEEQAEPNGDFPTVKSPNPEEPAALKMALELAGKENADIVIGTDPDCDRLGVAVRNDKNEMVLLNGNQTMVLMTHFLLEQWKKAGNLNGNQFVASTIVSTPMVEKIAKHFNVKYIEGLTGFKWIAKMIKDFPELDFIGGGEESFGYLVGDFVRDKDAVTATLLACEIAAQKKNAGSSMFQYLNDVYNQFGNYREHLISITKKGKQGAEEISAMMKALRENPFKEIAGSKVVRMDDILKNESINFLKQETLSLNLPKSNVLIYYTEDGSKIAARPSGTEPKIKFYISVNTLETKNFEEILQKKIDAIAAQLNVN